MVIILNRLNDSTTPRAYTYNHFDQLTQVTNAAGNQTLVKTTTCIWTVAYDAENRPVSFTNAETNTVIECAYDHMGRRATKKVTVNGNVTLHQRYLYRGYLQIAGCELYGQHGYIRTNYTYPPYGAVTAGGDVTQPIQWSSEFHNDELALVYYNYRHYNPMDGRWIGRDS